jgi:hypothetical protein
MMEVLKINTFSSTCGILGPQWTQIVHQTVSRCMVVQCHKNFVVYLYLYSNVNSESDLELLEYGWCLQCNELYTAAELD